MAVHIPTQPKYSKNFSFFIKKNKIETIDKGNKYRLSALQKICKTTSSAKKIRKNDHLAITLKQNNNGTTVSLVAPLLSNEDSNLDKQNQNLLCYHYTIRQFSMEVQRYYFFFTRQLFYEKYTRLCENIRNFVRKYSDNIKP